MMYDVSQNIITNHDCITFCQPQFLCTLTVEVEEAKVRRSKVESPAQSHQAKSARQSESNDLTQPPVVSSSQVEDEENDAEDKEDVDFGTIPPIDTGNKAPAYFQA